ncbi:protein trichome birefringence-like 14 isoform X1 [Selaginella moellendorffii]|nr:protein trichome birefringence-like 14 isoform X1 [Selaginella moellendorffii]|eukprot:XP_024541554.1 protein trichome birefringence-like 14 isoform X1 [Selaginella moellendorffii]
MRFLAIMVLIPGEKLRKRDSDQHFKAGGGGGGGAILYGMRARRALVLMLAVLCGFIVVFGWEGSPAASVLGSRAWGPGLRLELALFAGALDLSRFSKSIAVSHDGSIMELLNSTVSELATRKASPVREVYKQVPQCDYSKGKWLNDSNRPLYSGEMCSQFLSSMWACKVQGRKDFDYEKYRWQPQGCDLPPFDGRAFLSRWKNKTIAFVGDSLGRQQFQSLLCMITRGKDDMVATDAGQEYGFDKRPTWSLRPNGWAYRFTETNTTILFYWSASLCKIKLYNVTDPSSAAAMHLDRPVDFLKRNVARMDLVILNTGHHWNSGKINGNKWEMYVGGKKVALKGSRFASVSYSHQFAVKKVVRWLDRQIGARPELRGVLTALSPRHFMNGDWNSGGRCDNIKAFGVDVSNRPSRDVLSEEAVANTRVELLNITHLSQFRGEAHLSRFTANARPGIQDCLHWCLPGVPDVWNEILNAQLLARKERKEEDEVL